ncbi:MAG: DUF1190 domain-containing protein [Hyphomicrobiaceae bacterium]
MQRLSTTGLLTLAATAFALTACKQTDEPVAVKVFANAPACVAAGLDTVACAEAANTAEAGYEAAYPRYPTKIDCEENAGKSLCEIDRPRAKHQYWRPAAIGFIMPGKAGPAQVVVGNLASASGRATARAIPVPGKASDSKLLASIVARQPTSEQVAAAHPLAITGKPETTVAAKSDDKKGSGKADAAAGKDGKKHWGQ